MKPYLVAQLAKLSASGRPLNRGLWWDFPADERAWAVDDEYMFGDDYLMAPVLTVSVAPRWSPLSSFTTPAIVFLTNSAPALVRHSLPVNAPVQPLAFCTAPCSVCMCYQPCFLLFI